MAENKDRIIELAGNLTIERALEVKELFSNGLSEKGSITLDMEKLDSIDVTFIQLFHSFLSQAKSRSLDIHLTGEISEKVRHSLDLMGIEYSFTDGKVSIEG